MTSRTCHPQRLSWILIRHVKSQTNSSRASSTLTSTTFLSKNSNGDNCHLPTTRSFSNGNNLGQTSHTLFESKPQSSSHTRTPTKTTRARASLQSLRAQSSSSNSDGDGSRSLPTNGIISQKTASQIKNKGPISLKNTSRAQASAKLIMKNALHLPHLNTNNFMKVPSTNLPHSLLTAPSSNEHTMMNSGTSSGTTNHNTTHFVLGGTHCDPAPAPHILTEYGEKSVYTLVLLRHGESQWNLENRYTGWCDANLTERGRQEARDAGRLLRENGIEIDHAFTSILKRANFTTNMALNTSNQAWVPVTKSWRLNERHYGALQGYNKDTAYKELGIDQELVMAMRRSYGTRPPPMMDDHEHWHGNDRRYVKLSKEQLDKSRGESLKDTADRIMPFFNSVILPSLRAGNKCLIVSHANTLRTLIKQIDNISDEDIKGMSIPTGIPLLYRLDKNFKPVDPNTELEFRYMVEPKGYTWATSRAHGFHGVYLGDLERLQDIQRKRDATNRDWQRIILRNLALSLHRDVSQGEDGELGNSGNLGDGVLETRQFWWQIHTKMNEQEFSNMLILARMKDHLEMLMYKKRQRFITFGQVEKVIHQLHLDTEGHVVEPFVKVSEIGDREERAKQWYESMALDLEEECLIK